MDSDLCMLLWPGSCQDVAPAASTEADGAPISKPTKPKEPVDQANDPAEDQPLQSTPTASYGQLISQYPQVCQCSHLGSLVESVISDICNIEARIHVVVLWLSPVG